MVFLTNQHEIKFDNKIISNDCVLQCKHSYVIQCNEKDIIINLPELTKQNHGDIIEIWHIPSKKYNCTIKSLHKNICGAIKYKPKGKKSKKNKDSDKPSLDDSDDSDDDDDDNDDESGIDSEYLTKSYKLNYGSLKLRAFHINRNYWLLNK